MVDAARLAIRQTASELPRWAVEVDVRDASAANGIWDVDAEVTNALTAIGTQGTIAYMGPVICIPLATSIPIACVAKMAYVSPASVAPGLTRPTDADPHVVPTAPRLDCEPTFVRVIANDTSIGQALATRARIRALPRAYLMVEDGYLGDIIGDSFIDAHAELGGSIVGTLRSDGPTVADDAAARDVAKLKPDVIVHVRWIRTTPFPSGRHLKAPSRGRPSCRSTRSGAPSSSIWWDRRAWGRSSSIPKSIRWPGPTTASHSHSATPTIGSPRSTRPCLRRGSSGAGRTSARARRHHVATGRPRGVAGARCRHADRVDDRWCHQVRRCR